ncbi:hypoxanthine phosphoribosyltransferase [Microbacterium sp. W4I4]|uniref:phosphoribosyltransferase n=1 Tax=Microbacterium sp. W4I4 TaxID=3042295 RepID=UPI0027867006|nr:phosphoribosyltransferase [Microbacterium sp. W4I4]MDQ0613584.1 hypoxanthine phosphoribosyltransferase [Microbacterium sp. W4I4]
MHEQSRHPVVQVYRARVSPDEPVLLVDDLADSRWTLTVAARTLRQAGASAVLPFVLGLWG